MYTEHFDVIVIGGGPAGLAAGIYLSRSKLSTLVLNSGTVGGQLILTHEIANYPGVESTSGYSLARTMKKQATSFGAKIKTIKGIEEMDLKSDMKRIRISDEQEYTAHAVILAPGGNPRTLGVEGETEFKGRGVSYCATCDGEFFTDKEIVVVGGGNSALEEAVSLSKFASKITLLHQFDHFQAFQHAVEEVKQNEKINIRLEHVIESFYGEESLKGVKIKNLKTGEVEDFATDGAFIFIGYVPNTEFLQGCFPLNDRGEIPVDANMNTEVKGVFAAGDCIAKKYRQVTMAVGEATAAALSAAEYVHNLKQDKKQ
ncbi:MAG: thioredoxin-disulfide reductase [Bacteroidales bacterium]|nr:thioredoxin-disulfide reductase [Bacteroidales bacterium]